jgi:hypothetical protein
MLTVYIGVIADFGLTLGGLMRFLEQFFATLGIENLRFKPAYASRALSFRISLLLQTPVNNYDS